VTEHVTIAAHRRLAAIVVADVVGYSRLMEADEAETLAALKARRKAILDPVVEDHGGRIVKLMGDGALIEFASAVNAVQAALGIQQKYAAANEGLPEDRHVVLRIGINLGEVVGEGSDIYGDGVNIAARLEALADPGGICISAKVHDEVHGKIDAAFEDRGEQQLKNIAARVQVFAYRPGIAPAAPVTQAFTGPSIAVLPFTNMSDDPQQQYFSDGITEDIITELSRFRTLLVIARNSTFQYRDKSVDVRRIGAELGARYVVEGSVRKMGERIRITAQLIDATQGTHLWSERYDRNLEDLFDVQDEVTQTIVATVTGRLDDAEIKSATQRSTSSLPAYDCFMRGIAHFRRFGGDDNRLAREWLEKALAIDPNFAVAHALLGMVLLAEGEYDSAPAAVKDRALELAMTAVRLDPREGRCHLCLGWAYRFMGKFDLAVSHMEQGLRLNPNDANGLAQFGGLLAIVGRAEEGLELMRRAMRLNPHHPDWYWAGMAMNLFLARRYEEALDASAKIGPNKRPWAIARDAACLAQLGRLEEARAVAAAVLRAKPDFRISAELPSYKREEDQRHVREALLKAGLPE
jgi:TolB-like protein/lipoprotein NlpI